MKDPGAYADVVVLTIKAALGPILERLALAEQANADLRASLQSLTDLRDRVTTVETKSAQPHIPEAPVDLAPVLERVAAAEARLSVLGDLRDRVVTVETKAALQVIPEQVTFDAVPLLARIAALEGQLTACQDRLLVAETKAAQPIPIGPAHQIVDLAPVLERVSMVERNIGAIAVDAAKEIGALRERVAVAEVKSQIAGPAGPAGIDGRDGVNGMDGLGFDDAQVEHDGERNFTFKYARGERVKVAGTFTVPAELYRGVYLEGKSYERGDCVTWGGSEWHANELTTTKPGDGSKAWTLKVKRGRDGKDGRDGHDLVPVVSVGGRA